MTTYLFADNPATTTLSGNGGSITAVATSFNVSSSTGWPAASTGAKTAFFAQISTGASAEIVLVTNVSGTTWTAVRGQDGTTAAIWPDGTQLYPAVEQTAMSQFQQSNTGVAQGGFLWLPAGVAAAGGAPLKLSPGTNLTTPEAGAIEFDGASFFLTRGGTNRFPVSTSQFGLTASTSAISTTETAAATLSIAVGDLNVAGRTIRVTLIGRYTTSTSNATCTPRLRAHSTTGTVLFNTVPATYALAASQTNAYFQLDFFTTVRSTGASASIFTNAVLQQGATKVVAVVPSAGVALDLTSAANNDLLYTLLTPAAGTTITIDQVVYDIN